MPDSPPVHTRLKLLQYQAQLRDILSDSDNLDRTITHETRELIGDMRDEILKRIQQIINRSKTGGGIEPEWGHFWITRLIQEFNQVISAAAVKFQTNLSRYTISAYEVGRDFADKGLEFAAPQLDLTHPDTEKLLPKLNALGVRLASTVPGDLITNMQEKQLAAITKECTISMSMGEPPMRLMQRLSVNVDKGVWLTSFSRAEVVARTEVARVQEIGRQKRMTQQCAAFPELKIYQQFLVAPILQWPCKRCAQYDGNVYDQFGKLFILAPGCKDGDMPDLPIHPRCRCSLVGYIPGLSKEPATKSQQKEYDKEQDKVKVAQANLSKLSWDDLLKLWILNLPDDSKRTIHMPKNTPEETLQKNGLMLVRAAGFDKVSNVILIEHPRDMVGPSDESNRAGKRMIHRALGTPSRFKK